ncbi:MAG: hypothetical protein C5B58_09465 [Acidobacteria bacterium]|nr:MAG: hypothetical protein C5B58_09465 [Acidobacteriota bacterium]
MRMFVAPLFLRIVLKSGRMRPGIKVPGQLLPKGLEDDAQAIQSFRSLVKRFESHTGEFRPHPFFGSISPENTRRLHLIHANHHLGFLIPAS